MTKVIPRAVALGVAVLCGVVAWRVGGGAEPPTPPPRADVRAEAPRDAAPPAAGEDYEVALRLIELAGDARFEMPRADAMKAVMKAHWRQLKPPYHPAGDNAKFVTVIGLRNNATETQWSMHVGHQTKPWVPDVRVWNMNEGSFDQRESLVSPGAGTITYKLDVPPGARFSFAEGTVNVADAPTAFVVTVVDHEGTRHVVHRHVLAVSASRRWTDQVVDLSSFAGQSIALELHTEPARGEGGDDGKKAPGREAKAPADAGAVKEEALVTPGTAVALWGNPTVLARTRPRTPFNVLWIVIDALRPDVLASFHDDAEDAAKLKAPWPPLEALLPKVPGLTPAMDDLAARGVRFTRAYSAASWTRPGTIAMLAGARSSELGIDTTEWTITPAQAARFYAGDPPLLSLALRRRQVATRAFVNNYFLAGYAPVGLDLGFERVDDHRYRTKDTAEITNAAARWLRDNKDTRFFAFVNFNSPHEPYEPPAKLLERIPPPPAGPKDKNTRLYMAEVAKDDDAIGQLMKTLDETGLRDETIVVVTSDHGETLSSAHSGTSGLEKMPIRYHHAVSMFEETTRVPILVVAPGLLTPNTEVKARVRTTDIAPTVLELLGLEPHPRMSGRSLVALAKGEVEPDERVVVSEGRSSRAIMHGKWRLVVREGAAKITIQGDKVKETDAELYDLDADPGERNDLAKKKPDVVAEMKARLDAALENVPVAGTRAAVAPDAETGAPPTIRLRFAGAAAARRVAGAITVGDAKSKPKSFDVQPVDLGRDAFKVAGEKIELAFRTSPAHAVGFDLVVDPPGTPVTWDLYLDDQPWPEDRVFGGPFGLLAPVLGKGLATEEARAAAQANALPTIDPRRDLGFFVARERRSEVETSAGPTDEGAEETARLLREWGYAHGSK
ncbi:MAG: sulfatase [Labilithrix sp.]|nr:sulfatase [Labilithrix sp.]MCW5813387.1 sulfatase [Labilithrix sp.]